MKIKKTIFSTELEFDLSELQELHYKLTPYEYVGLIKWIKKEFQLNLRPYLKK